MGFFQFKYLLNIINIVVIVSFFDYMGTSGVSKRRYETHSFQKYVSANAILIVYHFLHINNSFFNDIQQKEKYLKRIRTLYSNIGTAFG